jgi:hypothetical protein
MNQQVTASPLTRNAAVTMLSPAFVPVACPIAAEAGASGTLGPGPHRARRRSPHRVRVSRAGRSALRANWNAHGTLHDMQRRRPDPSSGMHLLRESAHLHTYSLHLMWWRRAMTVTLDQRGWSAAQHLAPCVICHQAAILRSPRGKPCHWTCAIASADHPNRRTEETKVNRGMKG